jgi:hypothetical protein
MELIDSNLVLKVNSVSNSVIKYFVAELLS